MLDLIDASSSANVTLDRELPYMDVKEVRFQRRSIVATTRPNLSFPHPRLLAL
jgi:hypothetical protein